MKSRRVEEKCIPFMMRVFFVVAMMLLLESFLERFTIFGYFNPIFTPFFQRLNHDTLIMEKGEKKQLSVSGIYRKISFYSNDFKVADVTPGGTIYANRTGKAIIVVTLNNKIKLKCRVCVVQLNYSKIELKVGEKKRLKVKGTWGGKKWSSKNLSIVNVTRWGTIQAKKKGKTTVTVTVQGKTLSCEVIIK